MQRATYIKPSSKTQIEAAHYDDVHSELLSLLCISRDEWAEILFETGCEFIENNIEDGAHQLRILEKVEYGFWAFWISVFVQDDECLLRCGCSTDYLKENYSRLKQETSIYVKIANTDFLNYTINSL